MEEAAAQLALPGASSAAPSTTLSEAEKNSTSLVISCAPYALHSSLHSHTLIDLMGLLGPNSMIEGLTGTFHSLHDHSLDEKRTWALPWLLDVLSKSSL